VFFGTKNTRIAVFSPQKFDTVGELLEALDESNDIG
jgi:hypothetical protein